MLQIGLPSNVAHSHSLKYLMNLTFPAVHLNKFLIARKVVKNLIWSTNKRNWMWFEFFSIHTYQHYLFRKTKYCSHKLTTYDKSYIGESIVCIIWFLYVNSLYFAFIWNKFGIIWIFYMNKFCIYMKDNGRNWHIMGI